MKHKILLFSASVTAFSLFAGFGAGEMKNPGRTWYLSVSGSDKNDGKTPETAWKNLEYSLKKLKAGDTLFIGEGIHKTGLGQTFNKKTGRFRLDTAGLWTDGKPGSPIRICGAKNGKSILTGAFYLPADNRIKGTRMAEFKLKYPPRYDVVWEYPSGIMLQRVPYRKIAETYPGTYFLSPDNKITVHFSAEDQKGVHVSHDRIGLAVRGNYVLIENLTFQHYREAIFGQMNTRIKRNTSNLTIRNCTFTGNYKAGILFVYTNKALVTGNRFEKNGDYGSILLWRGSSGNLVTGNWVGKSPQTLRYQQPYHHNFSVQKYGGVKDKDNHFIGNVLADDYSFRWKPVDTGSRVEENIINGFFYAESRLDKVSIKRNLFKGSIKWQGHGEKLWEKDFDGTVVTFRENVRKPEEFRVKNKMLEQAKKLAIKQVPVRFPKIDFKDFAVKYVDDRSAVIEFRTPENDGWGSVRFRSKKERKIKTLRSSRQGVLHILGIAGLKPDHVYEFQMMFKGRRGENARSRWHSFKTAKVSRAPQTFKIDPLKTALDEAAQMARPGDTLVLLPGRHQGSFVPAFSGTKNKVITLKAQKGAIIDGMGFYAPLINLSNKKHWVIDGVSLSDLAPKGRRGMIAVDNSENIVIRNCRTIEEYPYTAGPFISGVGNKFLIENNISWGGSYPIMIRGNDHVIKRNTIVNATFFSVFVPNVKNVVITDNIFYRPCVHFKKNPAILFQNISGKTVCDRNVYYSPVKHHPFGGWIRNKNEKIILREADFAGWQKKSGFDKNSICVDPQFVDVEKGDFRLKKNSPAQGKGAVL